MEMMTKARAHRVTALFSHGTRPFVPFDLRRLPGFVPTSGPLPCGAHQR
jgi:hypothetical protein